MQRTEHSQEGTRSSGDPLSTAAPFVSALSLLPPLPFPAALVVHPPFSACSCCRAHGGGGWEVDHKVKKNAEGCVFLDPTHKKNESKQIKGEGRWRGVARLFFCFTYFANCYVFFGGGWGVRYSDVCGREGGMKRTYERQMFFCPGEGDGGEVGGRGGGGGCFCFFFFMKRGVFYRGKGGGEGRGEGAELCLIECQKRAKCRCFFAIHIRNRS